jgi:hypothetical protein
MALYVAAAAIMALSQVARSIVLLFALAKARQEDIPAIIRASVRIQVRDATSMNEKEGKSNGS